MYGRTTTTRFEEVKQSRRKTGTCPVCGDPVVKSMTFVNTVNPFNKNKEGLVKSYSEVLQDVMAEADTWKPDFRHKKCGG